MFPRACIFLALTLRCFAGPRDISAALEGERVKNSLPAVASAVVEDGRIIAIGATGKRRVDRDTKVTTDDVWHIGSCTKSMTATLVGVLVDAGKLRWNTTVAEALPGIEMHAAWRAVTLDHLLTQFAGVVVFNVNGIAWEWLGDEIAAVAVQAAFAQ